MPEEQLSSQEVTRAPLDKDHFLKIASEGRNPNNREMLLASLPKEIRNRLDSTHPTYQRNYDIWQAQLDAFLREEHPMLQGGGRENLAREIYQTLRSFGLDLTDRSLPLNELVKEFLNLRNLQPFKEPPLVLYGPGSIRERLSESQINALLEKQPQKILEKAGKRNAEEVRSLISGVEKILVYERQEGTNKLGKTIQETQKGRNGQEYFVDGEIAYLPDKGRAVFIGDTHGDSLATESITKQTGFIENMEQGPKDMTLVFLGDYADRGTNDIRNLEIVLALKERYPQNVILLRGNHEEGGGFTPYELPESLRRHFGMDRGSELHEQYVNLFKQFPNMLVTANGIVAVHAGVPNKDIRNLQELKNDEEAFSQIRWNDPNASIQETQKNYRRGGFYEFGQGPFERFIRAIGGKVMVRSHEYPQDGYELFFGNRLVTIFSNGGESSESHYQGRVQPKFMVVSLEEPISEIIPAKHLVDLKYPTS